MAFMSAKLSEALVKATLARDINDAFNKVFTEYLELKLNQIQQTIGDFREKWGSDFEEFKKKIQENQLKEDPYSYDVENDFWQWEEAETLKKHYDDIKSQWM
jgi:ATP-dependent Lon protease